MVVTLPIHICRGLSETVSRCVNRERFSLGKMIGSRRALLQMSAAAAAAACTPRLPHSVFAQTTSPAILHGNNSLEALGRSFRGRIIQPGESGYAAAAMPNNIRWSDVKPAIIAQCADEGDVRLALDWARTTRTPFAVRSGGHNYAGFSSTHGMLINLRSMNSIRLNPEDGTVTIAAGVNNQDMADTLRGTNWSVPTGRCPTVGTSGLVLGGGWGFAATHHGLTCDSLLASDVVLSDGNTVTASSDGEFSELFWGLCGGGGGNFGINTSFTFRLHDVRNVTIFNITWRSRNLAEIWMMLQKMQLSHPTDISTRVALISDSVQANLPQADLSISLLGQFFGPERQLTEILNPIIDFSPPERQEIREVSYWQARDYLIADDPYGKYALRSNYIQNYISEQAIDTILKWQLRWPGSSMAPTGLATQLAMGGKVGDRSVSDTAYVHRNANFLFTIKTAWRPTDSEDQIGRQLDWLADYYEDMQKHLSPQVYVNFPSEGISSPLQRYYGVNLERLKQLKSQVDPENIFKFPHSIPLA
jgi:hypothetical protein